MQRVRVSHQAPGFGETEIRRDWTIDSANAYVDEIECVTGTLVRIYLDDGKRVVVIRTKVCDPRD